MAGNRVGDQRERVLTRVAVFLNRDDLKRAAALLHAREARRIAPSLPGLALLQARLLYTSTANIR